MDNFKKLLKRIGFKNKKKNKHTVQDLEVYICDMLWSGEQWIRWSAIELSDEPGKYQKGCKAVFNCSDGGVGAFLHTPDGEQVEDIQSLSSDGVIGNHVLGAGMIGAGLAARAIEGLTGFPSTEVGFEVFIDSGEPKITVFLSGEAVEVLW